MVVGVYFQPVVNSTVYDLGSTDVRDGTVFKYDVCHNEILDIEVLGAQMASIDEFGKSGNRMGAATDGGGTYRLSLPADTLHPLEIEGGGQRVGQPFPMRAPPPLCFQNP